MSESAAPAGPDPLVAVSGFGQVLRSAGVAADSGRVAAFTAALQWVDVSRSRDVYWAGRLTLCADPDDFARYDATFAAVFGAVPPPSPPPDGEPREALGAATATPDETASARGAPRQRMRAGASSQEVLRTRDFAIMSAQERAELARLIAALATRGETRPGRRHRPAARGPIDRRRTIQAALGAGGELARLHHRGRRPHPRRVVLLVDISGSMAAYADALLRFAHAGRTARLGDSMLEVFALGTRLTRVTRELTHRDPDVARRAVAAAVPDWSGGTRLGVLLGEFLDRWGQRGLARGAVVVVLSDGWERGDPVLLGEQMARLHRLAHRVVWANPLRGRPGYAPLAAGMAAALPHVDQFVAGHSLEALEELASVIAGRMPAARTGVVHA